MMTHFETIRVVVHSAVRSALMQQIVPPPFGQLIEWAAECRAKKGANMPPVQKPATDVVVMEVGACAEADFAGVSGKIER